MAASGCVPHVAFALVVFAHLAFVWSFQNFPTQDGPSHLANAVILNEHASPGFPAHRFFDIRLEPLPNWTTQIILLGLLHLVTPLTAGKILSSFYIAGFAYAFRYFLAPFGRERLLLAPAGLLFLFNRCFLMGFYNYCLSLILFWLVLGYCVRRRHDFGPGAAVGLGIQLLLAYFTHLLGCALACAGAVWFVASAKPRRLREFALLAAALLPAASLGVVALFQPGFLGVREALLMPRPVNLPFPHAWWQRFMADLTTADQGLFQPYAQRALPLGTFVLLFYDALLLAMLFAPGRGGETSGRLAPRTHAALLAAALAVLYFIVPDFPSKAVGFLKARFVLLPPLLVLAVLRLPRLTPWRVLSLATLYGLLVINLWAVGRYSRTADRDIAEFTAGLPAAGRNHVVFVMQGNPNASLVQPLLHAADYYCLTTGNINLDNYQAELSHFPVRFRPGMRRGRNNWASYRDRALVDVVLVWDWPTAFDPGPGFTAAYSGGRLRVFRRVAEGMPQQRGAKAARAICWPSAPPPTGARRSWPGAVRD